MGPALDLENLGSFEPLQAGMGEIERNRDSRNAIGRKPFFREPAMWTNAQIPRLELEIQALDRILEPRSLELEPEIAEAPLEEFLG